MPESTAADRPIGRTLRELRTRRRLTQSRLAELSGVHQTTIADLEREAQGAARLVTLRRLATALGVPVSELIDAPKSR